MADSVRYSTIKHGQVPSLYEITLILVYPKGGEGM